MIKKTPGWSEQTMVSIEKLNTTVDYRKERMDIDWNVLLECTWNVPLRKTSDALVNWTCKMIAWILQ